ncbi:MAG: 30S ribosomal protein S12 methylthiotransferase RimO [Bacteroidaceae bacterium]|nr:30S ribosomal protein S12 methylthiotransferase RimO [Bacteroidaceae bacterium]
MKKNRVDIITMGCSKNLVDSERLMRQLQECGYEVVHDSEEPCGEIAVINTCGFIGDAKQESINMILEFCQRKEEGDLNKLYVMGCLSERYLTELREEILQVDKFYGKFNWTELVADLEHEYSNAIANERVLTTPGHYAYLKISEGCNRRCAYCAIPIITGPHKSRPMEEILDEVRYLVSKGVKEFQIIAQELTFYGVDLYKKQSIAELVEKISDIDGVEWIRLHYAYPSNFPYDLLRVMRERKNVCKYLDIALQHVSTKILKKMLRHVTKEDTYALVERMRAEVPGICLRTTMMVGFPGETDKEFEELVEFVKWAKFDRLGAFAYCEEDGTYAACNYRDSVSKKRKQERLDRLMDIQQRISTRLNDAKVGKVFRTIIDRIEGDYYVGRTEFDSPDVDTEVLVSVHDGELSIGGFYNVRITDATEFDLMGVVETEDKQ